MHFSENYRARVVDQILARRRDVEVVCEELDLPPQRVRAWVREALLAELGEHREARARRPC